MPACRRRRLRLGSRRGVRLVAITMETAMNWHGIAASLFCAFIAPAFADHLESIDRSRDSRSEAAVREFVPIGNRLFDANHCMEVAGIDPIGVRVVFYWGCGDRKIVSMECVYDGMGYRDIASALAPEGWHCNRPLPKIRLGGPHRVGDVAVRSVGGKATWAGCFVDSYGDFDSRENPYHGTACYRALLQIQTTVNRTQRSPSEVAKEILE